MAKCTACGSPLCAGCGSPNKFIGGITSVAGAALGSQNNTLSNVDRAKFERLSQMGGIYGQLGQGVLNRFPVESPEAPPASIPPPATPTNSGITGFDPNQKFQITPVQMSYNTPTPANMKGNAKPTFNAAVQASAEAIYGTPLQRQMSVPGAPVFLKEVPEGDEGAGLRELPNDVVEKMGYDSATKMISPLNQRTKKK